MTRKTTKTEKTSITLYNQTYELANKSLAKNLNAMVNAMNGLKTKTWEYAQALANIFNNKYYEDDFKDKKEFCKAIGLAESSSTKYIMACDFRAVSIPAYIKGLKDNGIEVSEDVVKNGFSVNKCYYLQALVKKNVFVDFLLYIGNETANRLYSMSERELEALLKEFKNKDKASDETAESEEKEDTAETVEDMAEIYFQGNTYSIPVSVLNKYLVKNVEEQEAKENGEQA